MIRPTSAAVRQRCARRLRAPFSNKFSNSFSHRDRPPPSSPTGGSHPRRSPGRRPAATAPSSQHRRAASGEAVCARVRACVRVSCEPPRLGDVARVKGASPQRPLCSVRPASAPHAARPAAMKTPLALCLLIALLACADAQDNVAEGAPCAHRRLGVTGTCRYFRDCPAALEDRKNNVDPQGCGWRPSAVLPNVCCVAADSPPVDPLGTKRQNGTAAGGAGSIARRKCREYSASAMQGNQCHKTNPGPPLPNNALIVDGVPAKQREFPHMALLGYGQGSDVSFSCGGTLVSDRWVMTAAHCLSHPKGLVSTVVVGDLDYSIETDDAQPQRLAVVERVRHPDYVAKVAYNDIALLRLDKPVTFSVYARPACLHTEASEEVRLVDDAPVLVTGWGALESGDEFGSTMLRKALLNITPRSRCETVYANQAKLPKGLAETQMCAGHETRDACQGDSGGPLQVFTEDNPYCMYHVVGVVSTGILCGSYPGVYTRVASYVPWIESVVWPQG